MKATIIFLIAVLSASSFSEAKVQVKAEQFKVKILNGNQRYIIKRDKELIAMQVPVVKGAGEIINVLHKKQFPNVHFVVYRAGQSGTSQIVEIYRAAVWSPEKNEFIGDIPFKKVTPKDKKIISDIKWTFEKGDLVVKEEGYSTDRVKLK
jgi:hypothetical protein